jgi:threonine synthase
MTLVTSKPKYTAIFQCINPDCKCEYELQEIVYLCKKCGDLLQVKHDTSELKKTSADEWKNLFDDRLKDVRFPNQSGIWNKREWVLPAMRDENIVSSGEGKTHLYEAKRLAKELGLSELYIKQCGVSHTGSFKDLGMTVLVSHVNQLITDGIKIKGFALVFAIGVLVSMFSAITASRTLLFALMSEKVGKIKNFLFGSGI